MAINKRKPGALYFTSVARAGPGKVILTGNYYALEHSDERRTAFLTLNKGVWGGLDLSGIAHAVRLQGAPASPSRQYLVLERNRGLSRISIPATVKFERIHPERQGFLMDLRFIAGNWYAVGGNHQIYRLDGGAWHAIDHGVYVSGEAGEAKLLLSIDGRSANDLYAVGFGGVIFHFDGQRWSKLESPTNCGLQRVLCASDAEVYICGYANSLFRGNARGWQALTDRDEDIVLWDMVRFKGKVYVCSKKALYIVERDALKEVRIPVEGPTGFYRMDSDEDELWTCGNECVLSFDGKRWKQYVFPDNA